MENTNGRIEENVLGRAAPGLQLRANSISSMASSSHAGTSILGDISQPEDDSDYADQPSLNHLTVTTDIFGFKGGEQYTNPNKVIITPAKLRKREGKWLRMLDHWSSWMANRFPDVKNRCRKGIPPGLRGRAWQRLSGSEYLLKNNPGKYDAFLQAEADPNHLEDIEKDLHRQFPFHEMFEKRGGSGQQDLRNVLQAYTVYCPEVGYCQAQAPIVAVLLMHMPAEEAFWCMVAICDHYLQGYFSHGLEAVQIDGWVMQGMLRKVAPALHKHMVKHEVQPVLYMTEWFMCVFARTLPWASVLRLWDMFFCEGVKVIFRCALVLLRSQMGSSEKIKKLPGLYETVEALRKIDPKFMEADTLMFQIINLKITERELEHEFKHQRKKMADSKAAFSKDSKRLYRYKPTYLTKKETGKQKKQVINALSADSAQIHKQVITAKRNSKKKNEKTENVESVSTTTDKVDKTIPSVVTSFAADKNGSTDNIALNNEESTFL